MSTVSNTARFLASNHDEDEGIRIAPYSPRGTLGEQDTVVGYQVRFDPRPKQTGKKTNYRVLRRLQGYVIGFEGREASVMLVENNEEFTYQLPAERLWKEGIKVQNQPFQMDEVETQTDLGTVTGYVFRPLAKTSDAYVQTLVLDDESKRKRDLIFKKFGKA